MIYLINISNHIIKLHNKVYGYEAVLMAAFALGMNAKLYRTHRMWGRACESQTEYMCALPLFLSLLR